MDCVISVVEYICIHNWHLGEMAYAADLKSSPLNVGIGSNPIGATKNLDA